MDWLKTSDGVKPEGGFEVSEAQKLRALTIASKPLLKGFKSLIFSLYDLADSPELLFVIGEKLKKEHCYYEVSR